MSKLPAASSLLTQIILRSTYGLFGQISVRSPNGSTSVEGSWRLSQGIDCWRFAYCGSPASSLHVGSRSLAQVSLCLIAHTHAALVSQYSKTDYHLFATLENSLLDSGPCLAQVSMCVRKQNSDPTLDSPGSMKHTNPTRWLFALTFLDTKHAGLHFATTNYSSVSLSWARFDMVLGFLIERKWLQEKSRTSWRWTNEEDGSNYLAWNYLWSTCPQVGSWCQCIWFGVWVFKLTLSNNQSNATLCVLDTWLIVGLLPFLIILITTSLPSKYTAELRTCVCDNAIQIRQFHQHLGYFFF